MILINDFISSFNKNKFDKKEQSLLKNGFQSSGNIFLINENLFKKSKKIIINKLKIIKIIIRHFGSDSYTQWPKIINLYGWLIIMNKGGSLVVICINRDGQVVLFI